MTPRSKYIKSLLWPVLALLLFSLLGAPIVQASEDFDPESFVLARALRQSEAVVLVTTTSVRELVIEKDGEIIDYEPPYIQITCTVEETLYGTPPERKKLTLLSDSWGIPLAEGKQLILRLGRKNTRSSESAPNNREENPDYSDYWVYFGSLYYDEEKDEWRQPEAKKSYRILDHLRDELADDEPDISLEIFMSSYFSGDDSTYYSRVMAKDGSIYAARNEKSSLRAKLKKGDLVYQIGEPILEGKTKWALVVAPGAFPGYMLYDQLGGEATTFLDHLYGDVCPVIADGTLRDENMKPVKEPTLRKGSAVILGGAVIHDGELYYQVLISQERERYVQAKYIDDSSYKAIIEFAFDYEDAVYLPGFMDGGVRYSYSEVIDLPESPREESYNTLTLKSGRKYHSLPYKSQADAEFARQYLVDGQRIPKYDNDFDPRLSTPCAYYQKGNTLYFYEGKRSADLQELEKKYGPPFVLEK